VTIGALGVQTIFASFFIGLLTMRSRREEEPSVAPVVVDEPTHATHA
jgi:hypothetical protein